MSKKDELYEKRRDSWEDDEWEDNFNDRKRYDHKKSRIRENRRNKYQQRDDYLEDHNFSMF